MSQFRFQILFYKFIQIQTATSQLTYEIYIAKKKILLSSPSYQIFQKKKSEIQKKKKNLPKNDFSKHDKKSKQTSNKQLTIFELPKKRKRIQSLNSIVFSWSGNLQMSLVWLVIYEIYLFKTFLFVNSKRELISPL